MSTLITWANVYVLPQDLITDDSSSCGCIIVFEYYLKEIIMSSDKVLIYVLYSLIGKHKTILNRTILHPIGLLLNLPFKIRVVIYTENILLIVTNVFEDLESKEDAFHSNSFKVTGYYCRKSYMTI